MSRDDVFNEAIAAVEAAFGMKRTALVKKHTNLLAVLAAHNITATCDAHGDWEISYHVSDVPVRDPAQRELPNIPDPPPPSPTLANLLRETNRLVDSVQRCEVCTFYKCDPGAVAHLANEVGMHIERQRRFGGVTYRIGAGLGELTVPCDGVCDNCDVAKLRRALGLGTLPPPAKA